MGEDQNLFRVAQLIWDSAASSSSGDNYKTLSGKLVTDKRESYIRVWRCLGDQFIEISFKRTIRVPDNHDKFELPPDLGSFPLFPVAEFTPTMPAEMTAKGGVFFPMHRKYFDSYSFV